MEHSKICEAMNRVILDQGNSILKSHLPCHIHHLIINQATISLLLEEVADAIDSLFRVSQRSFDIAWTLLYSGSQYNCSCRSAFLFLTGNSEAFIAATTRTFESGTIRPLGQRANVFNALFNFSEHFNSAAFFLSSIAFIATSSVTSLWILKKTAVIVCSKYSRQNLDECLEVVNLLFFHLKFKLEGLKLPLSPFSLFFLFNKLIQIKAPWTSVDINIWQHHIGITRSTVLLFVCPQLSKLARISACFHFTFISFIL